MPASLGVLVNATALRVGGGGTYIVEQLAALGEQPGVRVTAFATGEIAARLRAGCGPAVRVVRLPERALVLRLLHEQLALPWHARRYDIVYQAGGFAMFLSPRPQVITNQNPHHFSASARAFWRDRYPLRHRLRLELEWRLAHASVRRAEEFVTVSRAFCAAVEEDLGPRENLRMLPSAAPRLPEPPRPEHPVGDGEPYALTVAHDYPHKDWDGLIGAFRKHLDLPRLVIAGAWRSEQRRAELERELAPNGAAARVTLLGSLADRGRIAALYRGAACFVAHSFLEAGPLTPREAASAGLPLVASDIPAHREVGGPGAFFYDPRDPDALAGAVRSALFPEQASGPARPGPEAGGGWTWADNADGLMQIFRQLA